MNKYKYKGFVYLVSVNGTQYAVKFSHLEEFVALYRGYDGVVINDFVMSQIHFDYEFQWYKQI